MTDVIGTTDIDCTPAGGDADRSIRGWYPKYLGVARNALEPLISAIGSYATTPPPGSRHRPTLTYTDHKTLRTVPAGSFATGKTHIVPM